MIRTRKDLEYYLQEDAEALGYCKLSFFKRFCKNILISVLDSI